MRNRGNLGNIDNKCSRGNMSKEVIIVHKSNGGNMSNIGNISNMSNEGNIAGKGNRGNISN